MVIGAVCAFQFDVHIGLFTMVSWASLRLVADIILGVAMVICWSAACSGGIHGMARMAHAILLVVIGVAIASLGHWTCYWKFARDRAVYVDAIKQLRVHQRLDNSAKQALEVIVDRDNDNRIAFEVGSGVTDNWIGVVYDPTEELDQFTKQALERGSVCCKMFGGRMIYATRVDRAWYVCVFT
jgi:hypothetical protein